MRVKLLRPALVESNIQATSAGKTVEVSDERGKQMIALGVAEAASGGGASDGTELDFGKRALETHAAVRAGVAVPPMSTRKEDLDQFKALTDARNKMAPDPLNKSAEDAGTEAGGTGETTDQAEAALRAENAQASAPAAKTAGKKGGK